MPTLTGQGILTAETMLRMAQTEINELKHQLMASLGALNKLEGRLQQATLAFCAVVVQAGGTVTITTAELEVGYNMSVKIDPATHAKIWTIAKQEPKLEMVTN